MGQNSDPAGQSGWHYGLPAITSGHATPTHSESSTVGAANLIMAEGYINSRTTPTPVDTERQLLVKILTALNNLSSSRGAGATFGNYGGGQPSFTPTSGTALAIDTSNQNFWAYDNGAWHLIV